MNAALIVIGTVVVFYSLAAKRLSTTLVTGPMVFTAVGVMIGPKALDLVDLTLSNDDVEFLLNTTLAVVLFVDATHINLTAVRRSWSGPARLLFVSFPVMLVLGYAIGWALFPTLGVFAIAAIATILAPTDAALGQAVITNPKVPLGVRQTLSVESGLNDGLALPVLIAILAVAQADTAADPAHVLVDELVKEVGFGLLAGLGAALLAAGAVWTAKRMSLPITGIAVSIASLGALVAAAGTAQAMGGSVLIAAFVAGLAMAPQIQSFGHEASAFPEEVVVILTLLAFVVFGGGILSAEIASLNWQVALYAILSLAVLRPLAVAVGAIGSGAAPQTITFIGWFGPRGLASILFVAVVARKAPDFEGLATIFSVMTWTVAASIVAHGLTAWPGSNAYARWATDHPTLIEDGPEHRTLPEDALRPRAVDSLAAETDG
ncbi:MAG: cation:proton antiporter [Actinobacteria bacterium]|nr:cation:proton antiporter [Actinomycetota bacterium]